MWDVNMLSSISETVAIPGIQFLHQTSTTNTVLPVSRIAPLSLLSSPPQPGPRSHSEEESMGEF